MSNSRTPKKLISRLVTNKTFAYKGHNIAVDPNNPGTGPGSVDGWDDCDPEEGQEVLSGGYGYYDQNGQWVPAEPPEDGSSYIEYDPEIDVSPGARAEGKSAGQQLLFGQYYLSTSSAWDLRNTPRFVEVVDRLFQAHSADPESWVVEITAQEIADRYSTGSYGPEQLAKVIADGEFFSVLKARIRSGEAGERYVDVDIADGTRVPVEGKVVSVSILTPEGYTVAGQNNTITIGVGESAVLTNTNVAAQAYVTESIPESIATYTHSYAIANGDTVGLTRIEIPPRAYSVTVYTNIALPAPGFEDRLALGGASAHDIVVDATTLRAEEIVIPKNCNQIRIPGQTAAANSQYMFVFAIR